MNQADIKETSIAVFWHRRDLRLHDNVGLSSALNSGYKVLPLFIFDTDILNKLNEKSDARVAFIHSSLRAVYNEYAKYNSSILVTIGKPVKVFEELLSKFNIKAVYANNDYEPYAKKRDEEVKKVLDKASIAFFTYKDHVIFEKDEVLKADGKPYTVFTPYMRRWKERFNENGIGSPTNDPKFSALVKTGKLDFPALEETGFHKSKIAIPDKVADLETVRNYHKFRDIPSVKGTTRIGIHLRFGTLSTREMVFLALKHNETWLNELIWREFFQMIIFHFPHTAEKSFKPAYDRIEWINDEKQFQAWCDGKTGFPIVDAGMRELLATGFMHNRVRMITASFLVKDLLVDWRWGEAWFAEKLLDFELASNVGNWQWVAGSGCDAAPYFRVFNPELQAKKYDPNGSYIRKWIPELNTPDYPKPIIDHAFAKNRTLKAYKAALQ